VDMVDLNEDFRGLSVIGEFADVKYENSDHGVYEYLKRTALANPHCQIKFVDPTGKEFVFLRAVNQMPAKPIPVQPHPLGLSVNDLLEFAHASPGRKISSFMVDTFARTTANKVNELKELAKSVDFDKQPKEMTWSDSEELIKAIKAIKWIAPDSTAIVPIGEEQVKTALKNILNPEFMSVVERKPRVFRGGIPFVIEAAVAYGGNSGKQTDEGYEGNILRFANKVPLLFDAGNCALTEAVKGLQWKRYNIDMDAQPISVFVNMSSTHIPYSGVGKEAVSKEDEIIEEIKLAVMEAARGVQHFIRGKEHASFEANRYKATMRYAKQLAGDLGELTGNSPNKIEDELERLVAKHYPHFKKEMTEGKEDNFEQEGKDPEENDSDASNES
ncbi:MAG: DNA topoisomerase VI subunit B, partial [Candidatus Marsarchaeota archaeon]|nr:DNA topoisomerase VI subunit B [Candidatus Marsarchaeota archaeon]